MENTSHTAEAKTVRPLLGVFAVLMGASLATFFGRLLSVGAPDLRGALGLSFDSASWIGTSYNMGLMFIGPFSVFLSGLFGPRRVLLISAYIFTVACLVMPFAGRLDILIGLLVLAGLAAGTFYPLTLSFVLRSLPQKYLHLGIGAYGVDIIVTTHLAHSYEGWILSSLSWPWLFWTFALLTPMMIWLIIHGMPSQPLPQPKPGQETPSWRGFFYASLGAALLYGGIDQGQRLDWWRSGVFVAMVVSGLFLVVCALVRHFSRPNPLVNFPFLRQWNIVLLGITVTIFRFVLLATVVLVPSYLSTIKGYRPEQTGPVLLWLAVPEFLAAAIAVYLLGRIDARIILAAGFGLIATGCLMDSEITTLWSGNSFELSQLILAFGDGLAFTGMVGSIILTILNSGSMKDASAVLSFGGFFQSVRLFGGELGASFVQFFLHHRQIFHYDMLASGIAAGSPATITRTHLLAAAMSAKSVASNTALGRAGELFGATVSQQAFTLSIMDAFTVIAYTATGCLVIVASLHPMKIGFKTIISAPPAGKASS